MSHHYHIRIGGDAIVSKKYVFALLATTLHRCPLVVAPPYHHGPSVGRWGGEGSLYTVEEMWRGRGCRGGLEVAVGEEMGGEGVVARQGKRWARGGWG